MNGHGYVKVQPTLQLLNHPSIFAVGDIMEWPEQKQAAKLGWHVPIVVANIIGFLNGTTLTKKYTGAPEMIVITNGRVSTRCGCRYLPLTWWFTEGRYGLFRILRRVHTG
jgi:NADH dehydrogenase FAD-containing subunit